MRTLTEAGQAEFFADELARYKLAWSVEVRWAGSGDKLIQGGATGEPWRVLYSGRTDSKRQHGVTIAVCQSDCTSLFTFNPISPRLITATFQTLTTPVTIVQAYAPTNAAPITDKLAFYDQLQYSLDSIPASHYLLLMRDLNVKPRQQAELWQGCIGRFGLPGAVCDNGQRLLDVCAANRLVVTDTLFQHKFIHLHTRRSPDGVTKTTLTMSPSSKGTQAQSRTPGLTEGQMSAQTTHSGADADPTPPPVSKQPLFTLRKAEQRIKLLLHMLSVQHLPPVTISSDGNSLSMRSLSCKVNSSTHSTPTQTMDLSHHPAACSAKTQTLASTCLSC